MGDRWRFLPGCIVATPGAVELLGRYDKTPADYLNRHLSEDWGNLGIADKRENELSVSRGYRNFSSYEVSPLDTLWVITEADRSATTLLLPEEY
jgi:hypothetical protein